MQTHRDAQIVDWIARLGAAGAEHVMRRFSLSLGLAPEALDASPGDYSVDDLGWRWRLQTMSPCP